MRFSCDSKELTEAVLTVIRVMAVRTPREILQGIHLDADEEGLFVTASDGNMTSVCRINAVIETDGCAVLPGRLLSDILRKLPAGQMQASLNERFVLTIRCRGSRFNIAGKSAEEYPLPEQGGFQQEINMPEPMLKEIIHQTSFAVPLEDQRVVLTGGYLNLFQGSLDMVGLDGFRMAVRNVKISDVSTECKAIIPKKAMDEIERLMGDEEDKLASLSFSANRLMLKTEKVTFYTSLIEGQYIDYKRVIPTECNLLATVDTQQFADAVERVALIARSGRGNLIRLDITQNQIVFSAASEEGDVREELGAQTLGIDMTISFNVKYLSEIARVVTGKEIQLKFGSSVSPCVICPPHGSEYTFLVLPVRTNA